MECEPCEPSSSKRKLSYFDCDLKKQKLDVSVSQTSDDDSDHGEIHVEPEYGENQLVGTGNNTIANIESLNKLLVKCACPNKPKSDDHKVNICWLHLKFIQE